MTIEKEKTFHGFLNLPVESQIAVIQQINDDRTLFRLFAANRYMWSFFKDNINIIFKPRISHLTDQPVNPLSLYKGYSPNKNKARLYVQDPEENHTVLSYMVFKGYEKAGSAYLATMANRDEMRHKVRNGYNLLCLAILSCNPAMVDLILAQPEASQLIDEANAYGDKPIHIAARVGNRQILKSLVTHASFNKDYINSRGNYSYCPLTNFCKYCPNDDLDFLQDLIGYAAKVDDEPTQYSSFLNDPIFLAIIHNKPKVAMVLLGYKKHDIKRYVSAPAYTLAQAIKRGYKDIVKLLALDCGVEIEPNCTPLESLLIASLSSFDLELIRIVFQIESRLYTKVARIQYERDGQVFNLPVFADYLLGAMQALISVPAGEETFEIYNLLVEFGLNTSMIWYDGGKNIFHYIATHLVTFLGKTQESIAYAEKIVSDLLHKDAMFNFRNKSDDRGVTPIQLLPDYKHQKSVTTFDEAIKDILSMAKKKETKTMENSAEEDMVEWQPVHDDADHRNQCTIM